MQTEVLWAFFPLGYALTLAVETPVLVCGLSPVHSLRRRLFAAIWLTACTYPIVVLVLPLVIPYDRHYGWYLAVTETFAPAAECLLFSIAFHRGEPWRPVRLRDAATIVIANLTSFAAGQLWRLGN